MISDKIWPILWCQIFELAIYKWHLVFEKKLSFLNNANSFVIDNIIHSIVFHILSNIVWKTCLVWNLLTKMKFINKREKYVISHMIFSTWNATSYCFCMNSIHIYWNESIGKRYNFEKKKQSYRREISILVIFWLANIKNSLR